MLELRYVERGLLRIPTKPTPGTFIALRIPTAHDFRVISAHMILCAYKT